MKGLPEESGYDGARAREKPARGLVSRVPGS
jgi:hypothetical protein